MEKEEVTATDQRQGERDDVGIERDPTDSTSGKEICRDGLVGIGQHRDPAARPHPTELDAQLVAEHDEGQDRHGHWTQRDAKV